MFVQVPDARLHSLAFGHGPHALLAIGGWIGPGEMWLDVLGRLSPRWRTITYDHRGSGASTCTADRIRLDDLVDDLFAVLDAHGVSRCVLVAESSGAGVAMQAVLRAPQRFDGLVSVCGSWLRPVPGQHDAFVRALRADFPAAVDGFVDRCTPEPDVEAVRHWGRQMLLRASPQRAVELLESQAALTAQDRLGDLRLPTLILHGTADAVVPAALSEKLAAALPGSRLELLPGLGHVPGVTDPARVAAAIDAFFA